MFARAGRGEPPAEGDPGDLLGDDPAGAYRRSMEEALEALHRPGVLERPPPPLRLISNLRAKSPLWGKTRAGLRSDLEGSPGPPVEAVPAVEELLVHQVAPEGGPTDVEAGGRRHLRRGVGPEGEGGHRSEAVMIGQQAEQGDGFAVHGLPL